jgi:hypothetical protein
LALVLLVSEPAFASGLNNLVTVKLDHYYADEAFGMVASDAGLSWLISGDVHAPVSQDADNLSSAQVLTFIANQSSCSWQEVQGVVVVVRTSTAVAGVTGKVEYEITKVPISAVLKMLTDGCGLKLAIRGKLYGDVSGSFFGSVKEALDELATQGNFRWEISGHTVKISPLHPK